MSDRKRSASGDVNQLLEGFECAIGYDAPDAFNPDEQGFQPSEGSSDDCVICLCEMSIGECVAMEKCSHKFHKNCIISALSKDPKCPICRIPAVDPQGKSPSGTLSITSSNRPCAGHEGCGSIVLSYNMRGGVQKDYHTNPGVSYSGTNRVAYLPFNEDGKKLLHRLGFAFSKGLTFMVGTSLTTGARNQITWASIHHKTSQRGGAYGWPDDGSYFLNCNDELDNLRVPPFEDCPTIFEVGTMQATRSMSRRNMRSRRAPIPPPPFQPKITRYNAPDVLPSIGDTYFTLSIASGECGICNAALSYGQAGILSKCSHVFHRNCLDHSLSINPCCPTCGVRVVEPCGTSPSGSMSIRYQSGDCPGYVGCGTISIHYHMTGGTQKSYHPNPGMTYDITLREAYLPCNDQGKQLIRRLHYAFKHGLCFRVGPSQSTGVQSAITWSTIPHKSSIHGGSFSWGSGVDNHYFLNCNQILDGLHVPAAQDCQDVLSNTGFVG